MKESLRPAGGAQPRAADRLAAGGAERRQRHVERRRPKRRAQRARQPGQAPRPAMLGGLPVHARYANAWRCATSTASAAIDAQVEACSLCRLRAAGVISKTMVIAAPNHLRPRAAARAARARSGARARRPFCSTGWPRICATGSPRCCAASTARSTSARRPTRCAARSRQSGKVGTIIAADASPVAPRLGVSTAATRIGARSPSRPTRRRCRSATASLDLVVSALALQFVNDLPGTLIQIRRALKPDGLLLAALARRRHADRAAAGLRGGRSRDRGRHLAARRAVSPICASWVRCCSARASRCR